MPGDAPSKALVAEFATAVGRRGDRVLLLHEDNEGDQWVSLPEAVALGAPFTTNYRPELLVVDADKPGSATATESLAQAMKAQGLTPVLWASGRPDHRQLVVRVPDLRERRRWAATAKAKGMDVRRRSRPPLSPHRLGLSVRLVDPEDPCRALAALRPTWVPPERQRLTERTWRRLRFGDPSKPSGSEVVYAIAMGMVAKGWRKEQAYRTLLDPKNEGGAALRRRFGKRSERGARAWFDRVWGTAEEYVAANPPVQAPGDPYEIRMDLTTMLAEADTWPWPTAQYRSTMHSGVLFSVRGTIMRRCLEGIIKIGIKAATTTPYASHRHLLDVSGIGSSHSLSKALIALEEMGWIRKITKGEGKRASTYELLLEGERKNAPQEYPA